MLEEPQHTVLNQEKMHLGNILKQRECNHNFPPVGRTDVSELKKNWKGIAKIRMELE